LIDYQDGRLGHPTYDLCSLLDDCYYRLPTDVKNELLNYYYDKATKVGVITESKADFMNNYYLSAAQRIYKAIGTFHLQYHDKNNDRYLKHVGHAFENLKMTLTKLGDRRESLDLLCELYYDC
jgi:aminoglycoside/choline kinase family phosphotransferase